MANEPDFSLGGAVSPSVYAEFIRNLLRDETATLTQANIDLAVQVAISQYGLVEADDEFDDRILNITQDLLPKKADLGSDGKIPSSQIPNLAIGTSVAVANQAAMLALTASQVQPGDIARRGDGKGSWMLMANDPSVLANWSQLPSAEDVVLSVAGHIGNVVLGTSDIVGLDPYTDGRIQSAVSAGNFLTATSGDARYATSPTGFKTAAYTAVPGELVRVDSTNGNIPITLPAAAEGRRITIKKVDTSANLVTVSPAGSDTIDGATSLTLRLPNEARTLIGTSGSWVVANGLNTLASLDARYAPFGSTGGSGTGATSDVQVFTSGTTNWTKPAGAKSCTVVCVGGGSGGGYGSRGPTTIYRNGGMVGQAGGRTAATIPASALPATVPVTVGAGGAAIAGSNVDQSYVPGNLGGDSSFSTYVTAFGGGTNSATNGRGGSGQNLPNGGGITTGAASFDGNGQSRTDQTAGLAGTSQPTNSGLLGTGGNGGSASPSANGGAGGAGGLYGGGGGGGGAATTGYTSGGGGKGGDGIVIVITHF